MQKRENAKKLHLMVRIKGGIAFFLSNPLNIGSIEEKLLVKSTGYVGMPFLYYPRRKRHIEKRSIFKLFSKLYNYINLLINNK